MRQLPSAAPVISEEDLHDAGSKVRGVEAQRLERVWASCEPHLEPIQLDDGSWSKPDPRFLEIAVRVTDRMMRLYRLDAPGVHQPPAEAAPEVRQRLLDKLIELEARLS